MDPGLWEVVDGGHRDQQVAVLVRLRPGAPAPSLMRAVARFGDVVTARVARGDIVALREHAAVVSLKAARELRPEPVATAQARVTAGVDRPRNPWWAARSGPRGRGVVIGVVDWGVDVTHPNLRRDDGRTRLEVIWDQRPRRGGGLAPYGYGRALTRARIDVALAARDPFAALDYDPADADVDDNGSHGTHVIDIAAGVPREGRGGVAPGAALVFVHLASAATGPRSIGNSVSLLEAIDFIDRQAADRPCVINLSLGSHAGPHDGTTLVERALDAFVTGRPGRAIVQSAGNYRRAPVHATGALASGAPAALEWIVSDGDQTTNEFDLWYPGRDRITVRLRDRRGRVIAHATPDSHGPVVHDGAVIGRFGHRTADPNNGDNHVALVLEPRGEAARWQVEIEPLRVTTEGSRWHAWIERDEAGHGSQSRLRGRAASAATTTGTIANGRHAIVVGALDARTGLEAAFSSAGPTRDGRTKPDVLAPGVGIVAARSMPATGVAPLLTRKSGTSMATPHVTGTVALLYEAAGRALSIAEVRAILTRSNARAVGDPPGPGTLDLVAAVAHARRIADGGAAGAAEAAPDPDSMSLCEAVAAAPPPPAAPAPAPASAPPLGFAIDDVALARGVAASAPERNRAWWLTLAAGDVRPIRGLDPTLHPIGFANRVQAAQLAVHRAGADVAILGQALVTDGVLGAATLVALRTIARGSRFPALRAELSALGVDVDGLAERGAAAYRAALIRLYPPREVVRWRVAAAAPALLGFYADDPTDTVEIRQRWMTYFFGDLPASQWPAFSWTMIAALAREVFGRDRCKGYGGLLELDRRGVTRLDGPLVAQWTAKLPGVEQHLHIWHQLRADSPRWPAAQAQLGLAVPEAAAGAVRRWQAGELVMVVVYVLPDRTRDQIRRVRDAWLADAAAQEILRGAADDEQFRALADQLIVMVAQRPSHEGVVRLIQWETELTQLLDHSLAPIDRGRRERFFAVLEERQGLGTVFAAWARMINLGRRAVLINLVKDTRFRDHPAYRDLLAAHEGQLESFRRHRYDVDAQTVFIGKHGDTPVVAHDRDPARSVVGDADGGYLRDETVKQLLPARGKALCKALSTALEEVLGELSDRALRDEAFQLDEAAVTKEVLARAMPRLEPPLAEADFIDREWQLSIRVYALRKVERDGLVRAEIDCAMVQRTVRIGKLTDLAPAGLRRALNEPDDPFTSSPWVEIAGTRRWRSEEAFGEELFWLLFSQITDVIETLGLVTLGAAAALMFGPGVVALAGGGWALATNIVLSEILYVAGALWEGRPITFEGVLSAALMGALGAIGFRAGAFVGQAIGRAVLGGVEAGALRSALAWGVQKALTGAIGGVLTHVSTAAALDVIRVVREGGSLASWERYFDGIGSAAAWGMAFEIGGSAVLSALFRNLHGTVIKRASDVVKQLLAAKIRPSQWIGEATQAVSVLRQRLATGLKNAATAEAAATAIGRRVVEITKAWAGQRITNLRAMYLTDLLDLARLPLRGIASAGIEQLAAARVPMREATAVLAQLRRLPDRASELLELIGAVPRARVEALGKRGELATMVGAPEVAGLLAVIPPVEIAVVFEHGLGGTRAGLIDWAARYLAAPPAIQAAVRAGLARYGARVSADGMLMLALHVGALDETTLHGLVRATDHVGRPALDLLLRDHPAVAQLVLGAARTDLEAGPILRRLLADVPRGVRLMTAVPDVPMLRTLVEAAGDDVALVDELVTRTGASATAPLDTAALQGMTNLLRTATARGQTAHLLDRLAPHAADATALRQELHQARDQSEAELAAWLHDGTRPVAAVDAAARAARVYELRRRLLAKGPRHWHTSEAFVVVPLRPGGRWAQLDRPETWLAPRTALHERYLRDATAGLQRLATELRAHPPTLYAMRGNTAAGKTRAIRGAGAQALPELALALERLGDDLHITVNPDNAKVVLLQDGAELGLTSGQVHEESATLGGKMKKRAFDLRHEDGTPASILVDQRLLTVANVEEMVKAARRTHRRLVVIDVDAPLEMSLVGVLMRRRVVDGPVPAFQVVGDGFKLARSERRAVSELMAKTPNSEYLLFGTQPDGRRVLLSRIVGSSEGVVPPPMQHLERVEDAEVVRTQVEVIDEALIERIVSALESGFGERVRQRLREFVGYTWEQALFSAARASQAP
ncbi:MAG: S8 family serine peptidase [Myxococcales bacterium]|nr:S8 family serine peptidase [Myxococcales bacterium]